MQNAFFKNLRPADIIAVVVLSGGFYLMAIGVNHVTGGIITAVVVYYFTSSKNHDHKKDN